jgi:crotonobetainyl-CoA:carnitine CoA-transferase CaiB-like acyl-CoA transferase
MMCTNAPTGNWAVLLERTDTCFAPVLSIEEVETHPHIAARA